MSMCICVDYVTYPHIHTYSHTYGVHCTYIHMCACSIMCKSISNKLYVSFAKEPYIHIDVRMCGCSTGWRRPIGCPKLQVIFRKRANNYRALLPKMTYKDKASYGSSPPCIVVEHPILIYVYLLFILREKIIGLFCRI